MKTIPQLQATRAVRLRGTVLALLAVCFAALLSAPPAHAAAGDAVWTNRYDGTGNDDDAAYAIAVDGSGNVFVTGFSHGTNGDFDTDYATAAYSGTGVPLWTNRYNGTGGIDAVAQAMALDAVPFSWARLHPPYQTNATHVFITLPPPAGDRFYRLRKP